MGRKQYLYHATTPENAEKIKREGLKRKNGFCVYMSEKPFSWWKPGMTILRVRITGLKNLHVSPEDGLDEILSFEDINPLRIHEYEPTRSQWRKAYNHFREVTKMAEEGE